MPAGPYLACAASHDEGEFLETESWGDRARFISSFGIHPQWPVWKNADFLSVLAWPGRSGSRPLARQALIFLGTELTEDQERRKTKRIQTGVFEYQLDLAEDASASPSLSTSGRPRTRPFSIPAASARLPGVVFHSWPGTAREAGDLLARGVPGFFSFGDRPLKGPQEGYRVLRESCPWTACSPRPMPPGSPCRDRATAASRTSPWSGGHGHGQVSGDLPLPRARGGPGSQFSRAAYLLPRGES